MKLDEKVPLRFPVGTRVQCRYEGNWEPGTIMKHYYTQRSFGPNQCAPYQVHLDQAKKIFAPSDSNSCIKELKFSILDDQHANDKARKISFSDRSCALAMALHPRLGAGSPAQDTPPEVLRKIMDFTWRMESTRRIAMIRVRAGNFVDRIELHFSDGSSSAYGGCGGTWREPFTLEPAEGIVKIKARQGDFQLNSIQFVTSLGRESPAFGGSGGSRMTLGLPQLPIEVADLGLSRTVAGYLAPLDRNFDLRYAETPSVEDKAALGALLRSTYAEVHARAATEDSADFGEVGPVWWPPYDSDDEEEDDYANGPGAYYENESELDLEDYR